MPNLIETLRPTVVAIKLVRGSDNTFVFTVLENGLPKDMSQYALVLPHIRFSNLSRTAGGIIPGDWPQAQAASGIVPAGSKALSEWLNGGVGGQIHVVVPELDFFLLVNHRGTKNAQAFSGSGVFDIQVMDQNLDLSSIGGAASGNSSRSVQRAVTGTWTIDTEVTDPLVIP